MRPSHALLAAAAILGFLVFSQIELLWRTTEPIALQPVTPEATTHSVAAPLENRMPAGPARQAATVVGFIAEQDHETEFAEEHGAKGQIIVNVVEPGGEPAVGVAVSLGSHSFGFHNTVISSKQGVGVFVGLDAGEYHVTTLLGGDERVLLKQSAVESVSLLLDGARSLAVHVIDEGGRDVPGAKILAESLIHSGFTHCFGSTDANGYAEVSGLVTDCCLWAEKRGYFASAPIPLTYSGSIKESRVQLHLRPGPAALEFEVRNASTGLPVQGASVWLEPSYRSFTVPIEGAARNNTRPSIIVSSAAARRYIANDGGYCSVTSPPAGPWSVAVAARGFSEHRLELHDSDGGRIHLVELNPSTPIGLHVTYPGGVPAVGATVRTGASGPIDLQRCSTDRHGDCVLEIGQGLTLDVRVAGEYGYEGTIRVAADVRPSEVVHIELERGSAPTLTLLDLDGQPLAGWRVMRHDSVQTSGQVRRTWVESTTDADGNLWLHASRGAGGAFSFWSSEHDSIFPLAYASPGTMGHPTPLVRIDPNLAALRIDAPSYSGALAKIESVAHGTFGMLLLDARDGSGAAVLPSGRYLISLQDAANKPLTAPVETVVELTEVSLDF